MHQTAEYGIAAHWKYKEGKGGKVADEEKFAWVRRLLESQQDSDAQDFLQALKIDMFADEVFVFTPGGDVVNLPAGSTPIDFAYSIHSAVGNKMTGAIVNGRLVPYTHILQNGDIVKIHTSNSAKGPSRDWLDIIRSSEARNKIRQWFKKEKREENIVHGKMSFEAELRHQNIQLGDATSEDVLSKILTRTSFNSLEDLYAGIGYGGISAQKVVNKIRDYLRAQEKEKNKKKDTLLTKIEKKDMPKSKSVQGVSVEGLDNCLVKFAKCCTPVPGDPIIGFITRGFGVSVHRKDCLNYLKAQSTKEEAGRWIQVGWEDTEDRVYMTSIQVELRDRAGIVVDVASILNALNVRISSFNAKDTGGGRAFVNIDVGVRNRDELVTAMAKIMSVQGVSDVRRADG